MTASSIVPPWATGTYPSKYHLQLSAALTLRKQGVHRLVDRICDFLLFITHGMLIDLFQRGGRRISHALHRVLIRHVQLLKTIQAIPGGAADRRSPEHESPCQRQADAVAPGTDGAWKSGGGIPALPGGNRLSGGTLAGSPLSILRTRGFRVVSFCESPTGQTAPADRAESAK